MLSLALSADGPLADQIVTGIKRQIDDRPFIAPPASEPAMRGQPQVAEPVVLDAVGSGDQQTYVVARGPTDLRRGRCGGLRGCVEPDRRVLAEDGHAPATEVSRCTSGRS